MRAAILFEEGTNPIEYHYIRFRMAEAGIRTILVSQGARSHVLEDHATVGRADALIDEVDPAGFDAVLIPGGTGPEKLRLNPKVIDLVKACHERGKVCAAICHGQQVFISAGMMKGRKATAAWSMMDDLRAVGAVVPEGERVVRDGSVITAIFPKDLPEFCRVILEALSQIEGHPLPEGYPSRLRGRTWGMLADNATDSAQATFLRLRFEEEGGRMLLLGRKAGMQINLSAELYEWGETGLREIITLSLPDAGVSGSCDVEAEGNRFAVSAGQLDGIVIPGGLGVSMMRGHPGFRRLVVEMNAANKPLCTIGRGPKALFLTGTLRNRAIACAPQMKDDVILSGENIAYRDAPVVLDGNILSCRGTEDLPLFMQKLLDEKTWR